LTSARSSLLSLYVSVFISSLGIGMYIYFVPVYAQTFGATFLDLGLIGTLNAVGYAVTPTIVGMVADKWNRAWLYVVGLALNVVASAVLIAAGSVTDIALLRLLGGLAFAFFWPTSEILVSDLVPVEARVREIGRYSVAWSIGILVGPYIGGFVLEATSFRTLFLVTSAVTAVGILPALARLVPKYTQQGRVEMPKLATSVLGMKSLAPWYAVTICYGAIFSTVVAIFPGYANNVGMLPTAIGALFALLGIARAIVFATSGRIEKFGGVRVLFLAAVGQGASLVLFGIAPLFLNFGLAMIVLGTSFGVIFPIVLAIIARGFPNERLGLAIGSYETTFGIGFVVGPILAGVVANATSGATAFLVMSVFALVMLAGVLVGSRRKVGPVL
jgi:MFS family permease